MNIRLLLDMNLSPRWVQVLQMHGYAATHWASVGHPSDPDSLIAEWASSHGFVVVTHDLDFGTLLATTHVQSPSVVQIRATDALEDRLEMLVVAALQQYELELEAGALVVVDSHLSRVRLLPF